MFQVRRALVSVSDKSGLIPFTSGLAGLGIEILSTGGTAHRLRDAGVAAIDVSERTGFPEIMDGRVKTLHPRIHGGLLGRRGIDDAVMADHNIEPIDLLVVNLYPFEQTIARPDATLEEAIENIDIGGPAMLRAASKNHAGVAVVVDPADYESVLRSLADDTLGLDARRRLAAKAYAHTAAYDTAITNYLCGHTAVTIRSANASCMRVRASRRCATAKTRTSARRSLPTSRHWPARWPGRGSCRARNFRTTTSPTATPRSLVSGSSSSLRA